MEADAILKQAWEAVEKSGVPESLREVAFREAVQMLRGGESAAPGTGGLEGGTPTTRQVARSKTKATRGSSKEATQTHATADPLPDEDTFFSQLADESGATEQDLRDILQLTTEGEVLVTQPTKDLGSSIAEQARTVVALVASARGVGLGERPVNADAVRKECQRKRCFDTDNFASTVVARLKGFNAGKNRSQLVLTSKWTDDFDAAVKKALGRESPAGNES